MAGDNGILQSILQCTKLESPEFVVPNCNPEKAVSEYFISKYNMTRTRKMPEWDEAPATSTLKLILAERKLENIHSKQSDQKNKMQWRQEKIQEQIDDLRSKCLQLRQTFKHFNEFVEQNRSKKERCRIRIQEKEALVAKTEENIRYLKEKIKSLEDVETKLLTENERLKKYEDYLNEVVKISEFEYPEDVVERFDVLSSMNQNLSERNIEELIACEKTRDELWSLVEKSVSKIIGLGSKQDDLIHRLEEAKETTRFWEKKHIKVKHVILEKSLELAQIKYACRNLHQKMFQRRRISSECDDYDYKQQLTDIKETINIMKRIFDTARRTSVMETRSSVAVAE